MNFTRDLAQVVGLALVYLGLAWLGLQVATLGHQVTLLWAPAGVALAAVLLLGYRVAPGIALGAGALSSATGSPPLFTVLVAFGNTMAAMAGAFLIRRMGGSDGRLRTPRDALGFVGWGVGVSTLVRATIGATALSIDGLAP